MGISVFFYKNSFSSFWWGKDSLKTFHPTELQNYKAKKKNIQSALLLNIWIFNSDLMTFRKVLVLGFNWGKKLTLTMVCSLNKVLKKDLNYGKMAFMWHFMCFVFSVFPAGIRNTADLVQGWRQKEDRYFFISNPATLFFIWLNLSTYQDPSTIWLRISSMSRGMFYLCREKENGTATAFRARLCWISKYTLERSMWVWLGLAFS